MIERLEDRNSPRLRRWLPTQELIRALNEAQKRDAADERRPAPTHNERLVVRAAPAEVAVLGAGFHPLKS
jgi:hypothetical protein